MNKWKITAIIFIIITLLETSLIIWTFNYGIESIENENECIYNVCSNYSTYNYDEFSKVCSCFEDEMVVYQKYIR